MTPANVLTGVFLSILFGPLVGYWGVRGVEYVTGWEILPDLEWEEDAG